MNKLFKLSLLLFLFAPFFAPGVNAQVVFATRQSFPHRVGHFLAKHEFVEAAAVTGLSFAAEGLSAVHCHETDSWCYYTPNASGLHYTPGKILGYDALVGSGVVGIEYLVWHWGEKKEAVDPTDPAKHLIWFVAVPISVSEAFTAIRNTRPADTDLPSFDLDKSK